MKYRPWIDKSVAIMTVCCLLLGPGGLSYAAGGLLQTTVTTTTTKTTTTTAQTTPSSAPPASVTPPPSVAAANSVDGGWPRLYPTTKSGANIILYQPQVASWDNQAKLELYAAVAYTPKTGKRELGTIKATADTKVSTAERLVSYSDLQITEANFTNLDKSKVQEITTEIGSTAKEGVIGLDRLLAGLDKSQIIPKNVEGIKTDPPEVFFSKKPAILVNIDGAPIWSNIMGTDLQYAINTNWDLFLHTPSKIYYLRNNDTWLRTSTLEGGWVPATLPDSFKKLPKDDNWKEVNANIPGKKLSADKAPKVFLTDKPTELLLLKGEPDYDQVKDTNLYWVSNTESDLFREGKTGSVYYLVAGRWFRAPDFTGPWTFASLDLPEDFKKISLEHDRSRVLASVPGTPQAAEAVLLAQVPETARVDKKTVKAPPVNYQPPNEPKFEPIEKTSMQYAVNTDKQIIKVGDLYYMCFQAVWFMSKSPNGPWEVTGEVPKEIYSIPTESSVHNVTYVTVVEDDDDDDAVIFAAAAAYTGVMIAWGCAVWGTGYYYPPYVWYGGMYPVYYPRYPTYGYSAWYNPWTGSYGRGAVAYGPYGGAGIGARYNGQTGTYSRGAAAYGPYGSRGVAEAYNPRTGTYAQTRQGSNVYGSWGTTGVTRGDSWATTSRVTNNVTGNTTRVTQGSGGGTAVSRTGPGGGGFIAQGGGGDVYAGRDGSVYRNEGGGWQKYDNGSWNNVATPEQRQQIQDRAGQAQQNRPTTTQRPTSGFDSNTAGQLDRDRAVRSEGMQRSSDYGSMRSSSPSTSRPSSSPSYRPSAPRAGGGGGRRR